LSSKFDQAVGIATILLQIIPRPEDSDIYSAASRALDAAGHDQDSESLERLVTELQSRHSIWIGSAASLDDDEGHEPWLPQSRATLAWNYWARYETLLRTEKKIPPAALRKLDETTDDVLARLENPEREGAWDRRGLVVGHVQSGKTAHYTGLINKAADAGYKLIVVLAGRTNGLRSQTQLRIDEGFLGYDSRKKGTLGTHIDRTSNLIGVGRVNSSVPFPLTATTSSEAGDFNKDAMDASGITPGSSDPVFLVVKKHVSVLKNLVAWATAVLGQPVEGSEIRRVFDIPLLVIDDEADEASINTNKIFSANGTLDTNLDPTVTNERIRELLHAFSQSAYVGYTATPFANIFIHPESQSERLGPDLFPKNFILALPTPSDHIGPSRVFGVTSNQLLDVEDSPGLPLTRIIADHGDWVPIKHKSHHKVGHIPASLKEAIHGYLLAGATRLARGHNDFHHSMLIHATRFNHVQSQVADQVKEYVYELRNQLRYSTSDSLDGVLRSQWESDFSPTTRELRRLEPELMKSTPDVSWDEVRQSLLEAVSRCSVLTINGNSQDALEYWEHQEGLWTIAIGGDKLSRGLTLEGLCTSYYLRASRMYDTLMQMGRWFGYRPGYLDLCRLYTTKEINEAFRHITLATEELWTQFFAMADLGLDPESFGLKVLSSPSGLHITGLGKMRSGTKMQLSYAGERAESLTISTRDVDFIRNDKALRNLELNLSSNHIVPYRVDEKEGGNWIFDQVPADLITEFFGEVSTHPHSLKAHSGHIREYILACNQINELEQWTVAVVSNSKAKETFEFGALGTVGFTGRGTVHDDDGDSVSFSIVVSPAHESIDLDPEERVLAVNDTKSAWRESDRPNKSETEPSVATGRYARLHRPKTRGLVLIYPIEPSRFNNRAQDSISTNSLIPYAFCVSFPHSTSDTKIQYVTAYNYGQLELDLDA